MQFTKIFAIVSALAVTAIAAAAAPEADIDPRAANIFDIRDADAVGCVQVKNGLGCPAPRPINCGDKAHGNHHCCAHVGGCNF